MRRGRGPRGAVLALLLAAACGGPAEPETGPPDLVYGERLCARCGMSVDSPRFAAALRAPDGQGGSALFVYDDLGEIFLDIAAAGALAPTEVWVHDASSEAWIDGRRAYYVRGRIASPMGLGVEAHADAGEAARRAEEVEGEVLEFDALLERARRGSLDVNATGEEAR